MNAKKDIKASHIGLIIAVCVTLVGFLIFFGISSGVENRFSITYVTDAQTGVCAVSGCSKPTDTLSIPATYQGQTVAIILEDSFSNMSLQSLTLEAVTHIGDRAFRSCAFLSQMQLGKAESIGDHSFEFCKSLTAVTLPETVKSVGKRAFSFCDKLEAVYFLSDPESLGENIFDFCPNVVIYGRPGGNVEAYCREYDLPFQPTE